MSTFEMRMDQLATEIGIGTLTAKVEYDQVYAHRQHEDMTYKHPQGGGAQYLRRALYDNTPEMMEQIARGVFRDIKTAMISTAELLADKASNNAPKRAHILDNSDHPTVLDDGVVVYDRPPLMPRLTEEQIEALNEELQDPHHYYGAWPPIGSNAHLRRR